MDFFIINIIFFGQTQDLNRITVQTITQRMNRSRKEIRPADRNDLTLSSWNAHYHVPDDFLRRDVLVSTFIVIKKF